MLNMWVVDLPGMVCVALVRIPVNPATQSSPFPGRAIRSLSVTFDQTLRVSIYISFSPLIYKEFHNFRMNLDVPCIRIL